MSGLPSAGSQCGVAIGSQKAIAVSFTDDSSHKGLLFHSGLGAEGGGHIVQIPYLILWFAAKAIGSARKVCICILVVAINAPDTPLRSMVSSR